MALQCSVAARSPPLPWLTLLHGTFLSISDGEIHRMPLPNDASCHGSIDNWLFLRDSNGGCSLMNLFSKATLHLPKLASIWHDKMERAYRGSGILLCNEYTLLSYKFAVPLPLDSSPVPLVAVLINDPLHVSAACICYQPIATDSFISHDFSLENKTYDIAFCGGKLYALSASGKLYILEISEGHEGKPEVSCINSMVDLAEEPVIRLFGYPFPLSHDDVLEDPRTLSFVVYEADLSNGSRMWRRVESLGGQALFGGTHGSKSVPAVECGAQEDCIYFISDYNRPYSANPLGDSGIYNMRNGMITPLVRLVSGNRHSGVYYQWRHPRWVVRHLFPLLFAVPTKRPRHDRALTGDGEGALPERTKARGRRPSTLSSPGYLLWRKPPRTAHCLDTSGCCLLVDLRRRVPRPYSSSWADFQPELLGLVLRRLPSHADRVRLRAVCRPWRSNAEMQFVPPPHPWRSNGQMQPFPPPLPWLGLLDGTFLDIASCAIHRMIVPDDACCHGSLDNWLFLMKSDGGCSLMNPFSRAKLKLPKLATCNGVYIFKPHLHKLVAPSPLDSSPDSLVAVLTIYYCNLSTIFICQPPVTTDSSKGKKPLEYIADVAFFDGKLYAISRTRNLLILEITGSSGKKPTILAVDSLINSTDHISARPKTLLKGVEYICREYLVECRGRLLMVTRYIPSVAHPTGPDYYEHYRTAGFEVFEADLTNIPGRWRRVHNLGGQALFVGKHRSKAFPAGESGGAQEDCIYFMCDYPPPEFAVDPLRDSGVYNMTGIAAELPHRVGQSRPTWLFPTDTMRRIPSELTRSSSSSPSPEIYLAPAYFGGCYSAPLPLLRRALPPTSPISSSSRRPAASRRSRVSPAVSKSCMMAATQSSSWADLQMDILGLVLRRLPSLADRVRLRAVCRPWCSNAQLLTLPPPFPWLNLLDGTFLSISDGEIHRMPLPDDASCYGSIDNWLFLTDSDDGCSLMNPFSKATLQLPKLACIWHHERGNAYNACTRLFYKLAVPLPLDLSSDSLVAVLINDPLRHSVVCIVHRSIATDSFRFHDRPFKNNFYDIAFCGGKLYALSCGKLFTVEMSEVHIEKPKVPHVECIVEDFPIESHSQPCPENHICVTWPYLVESGGRLLNVIRLVGVPFPPEDDDDIFKDSLTFSFEVYEADLNTGSRMWRRVESLGDQALFVGRHCSKSLSAAEYVGAQEDCIYFMCDDYFRSDEDPLCDAGIYNMRSGVITPLLQENTAPRLHPTGEGHPTWFFPADGAIFHRLVGRGPTWPKSPCTEVHHRGRRTLDELTPSSSSPAVVYLAPLRRSLHGYRRQFSPPQLGGGYGGPPLSCMMAAVQSSSWADLQPELLGLVLTRLPSLADRVRLRAVCRPWRSNARLQPLPPPLPWLTLLNGTFLSISDGEIHCMPLPDDASCHCSIDNWLFLSHDDGGFSLMNPFSKATLQLPKLDTIWCHHLWYAAPKFPLFYKLAVPAPLDFSPTSLVVALIMNRSHQKALCICQPPVATESFRVEGSTMEGMQDFTFLDGKLYVLNNFNKLFILEIDESHIGNPKISSIECIIDSQDDSTTEPQSFPEDYLIMLRYYLVESGGGLLMVTRYVGIVLPLAEPNSFKHSRTLSFKVFEADLTTGSRMWRRSLPAAECGVPQEDCIYFMCDYWRPYAGEPLCDSGVYNMRNGVITPLLQDATAPRLHPTGRGDPAWFFPADVAT
uniref:F-box domain-containing protein n=1 Tax=Oryza glumipatula TaxID=40148 RepID=A0A0E0A509_9ORYZ